MPTDIFIAVSLLFRAISVLRYCYSRLNSKQPNEIAK